MLKLKGIVLVFDENDQTTLKPLVEKQGFSQPTQSKPRAEKKIDGNTITVFRNEKKQVLVSVTALADKSPLDLVALGYTEIVAAGLGK